MPKLIHSSAVNTAQLSRQLGQAATGLRGSTAYFVQATEGFAEQDSNFLTNAKVVLERYENGLLLHFFKSNNQQFLPVLFTNIISLYLRQGPTEILAPYSYLYNFLIRRGYSLRIAQYFVRTKEPTRLVTHLADCQLTLSTSGSSFYGQARFFSSLNVPSSVLRIYETKPVFC